MKPHKGEHSFSISDSIHDRPAVPKVRFEDVVSIYLQIDQVQRLSATHREEHGEREWSQPSTDLCNIKSKPLIRFLVRLEPRITVKALQDSLVAYTDFKKRFWKIEGICTKYQMEGAKGCCKSCKHFRNRTPCGVQTCEV